MIAFTAGKIMSARSTHAADILVVGAGIAGASAAFELSAFASVIVLERESRCGYHSTGRSAASFTENYGGEVVRRLAVASRAFLQSPPQGFCEHELLRPRGMITIGRSDQLELLERRLEQGRALVPSIARIGVDAALARVPILRRDYVAGAYLEPDSRDIDVDGLHQGFMRGARRRGARIVVSAEVLSIARVGGCWTVDTGTAAYHAPLLVNAAGAWADIIAGLAGAGTLGLVPKKRTAFNVPVPGGVDIRRWPLVDDVGEEFYFKADAGQLLVSPADATPSPPADVHPDDLDVATGVERLERATTLSVARVSRAWAGLRTFASDGTPVVGPDPGVDGFHWLAGQGGYGIKTSPALSRLCASLIRGAGMPNDLARLGLTPAELAPGRLCPAPGDPAPRAGENSRRAVPTSAS
jgi:D-arginine dehydrogenase